MEAKEGEGHITTSPAAFVEGGIQDLCDEACSICLEEFSEVNPSTVTNCRHEFHLHCILEWCQRNSQCPMCWQAIGLKDPSSQELFEGVELERNIKATSSSRASISQYTIPQDLQLGRLAMDINEPELEQHILLHLANIVRTGRVGRRSMREGLGVVGPRQSSRGQFSAHGSSRYSVFPSHPGATQSWPVSSLTNPVQGETEMRTSTGREVQVSAVSLTSTQTNEMPAVPSVSAAPTTRRGFSSSHRHSSTSYQNGGGSSELRSFSGSFKARFNEASMRYKESFSRTTRDLKERLFSRSSSMSGLGSGVMGEITAGVAAVSRIVDRLESKNGRVNQALTSGQSAEHTEREADKRHTEETHEGNSRNDWSGATSSSTR